MITMSKNNLNSLIDSIKSGDVLIVTREQIKEAIKQAVSGLLEYEDFHDFSKGVKSVDEEQIVFDVLSYFDAEY